MSFLPLQSADFVHIAHFALSLQTREARPDAGESFPRTQSLPVAFLLSATARDECNVEQTYISIFGLRLSKAFTNLLPEASSHLEVMASFRSAPLQCPTRILRGVAR